MNRNAAYKVIEATPYLQDENILNFCFARVEIRGSAAKCGGKQKQKEMEAAAKTVGRVSAVRSRERQREGCAYALSTSTVSVILTVSPGINMP